MLKAREALALLREGNRRFAANVRSPDPYHTDAGRAVLATGQEPIAIILGLISGAGETVTRTVFLNEAGEIIRITRDTVGGCSVDSRRPRPC